MINITNLFKSYDEKCVVNNLSFHVLDNEIYGFIGKNGAGKSTTLNILAGLLHPDQGHIQIKEESLVGYLPESPSFYGWMTPREYMVYLSHGKKTLSIDELLRFVGLYNEKDRKIGGFSRGMKQRLGFACALLHDPKIVILDEPTSALDPEGRKAIIDMILTLKKQGKTIIFSTHILHDVEYLADRILMIHEGKKMFEVDKKTFFKKHNSELLKLKFSEEPSYRHIIKLTELRGVETFTHQENELTLSLKDKQTYFEILNYIKQEQLMLDGITFDKPSLEDLFIKEVNQS